MNIASNTYGDGLNGPRLMSIPWVKNLAMISPMVLLFLVLLVYPVGQLLLLSIYSDGAFTLSNYEQLLSSTVYVQVMLITLKISLWTTILAAIAGYPVAYLVSMLDSNKKAKWLFWVLLSFWTSFLVRSFAWIIMLGRHGVINQLLVTVGIQDAPSNMIYNLGAVLVGMVHALMPLAVLTMLSVMDNIDRNLSKAALTLGARPGTAFWKVYFPLSMPGLAAASLMVFVTSVGFFIVPQLLGGRRETMVTQLIIERVQLMLDWGFAGALSVFLLVVVLLVFWIYDKTLGLSTMAGGSGNQKSKNKSALVSKLSDLILSFLGHISDFLLSLWPKSLIKSKNEQSGHLPLRIIVIGILLFLSVPALLMVPLSFAGKSGLNWPPEGFTLQHYKDLLDSPIWISATIRSFVIGIGASILSMLIGAPVAFLMVRGNLRGKSLLLAFVLSPIIIPRIIIAVGMFYLFANIGLVGTSFGLMIGHTVIAVPYVVMTLMAVLRNYDTRLDMAAQSLGATPIKTLRHVTLPILSAGFLASFLFAFATSFDELTIALFSSGGITATLPKQFWDDVTMQLSPIIAAVSTCLFAFIVILISFTEWLRRRSSTN